MKDYYQILGISRDASPQDIKLAYRKLVIRYHPDRNPDPEAGQKIREINEAYDVLGDPEKRKRFDYGGFGIDWERVIVPEDPPRHRDPAYRRRRPAQAPSPSRPGLNDLILKYQPLAVKVSIATLAFCGLLLLDFLLPASMVQEKIIAREWGSFHKDKSGQEHYEIKLVTNYDNRYRFTSTIPEVYDVNVFIDVRRSRLLNVRRGLKAGNSQEDQFRTTLYSNFVFIPIVLLLTSALGVFLRNERELQYSLGVINFFVLLLCLFLLVLS